MPKKKSSLPVAVATEAPPRRTTGEVLMALKKRIDQFAEQPWHTVARLKPLSEAPDAPFSVYAATPSGPEWVGEYRPTATDEELQIIAEEVVGIYRDLAQVGNGIVRTQDGEAMENVLGKMVTIQKADGSSIDVIPQRRPPPESEQQEQARHDRELAEFKQVVFFAETEQDVYWNNIPYHVVRGENLCPKPFYDIYLESRRQDQLNRRAMNTISNWTGQVAMPTYNGPGVPR